MSVRVVPPHSEEEYSAMTSLDRISTFSNDVSSSSVTSLDRRESEASQQFEVVVPDGVNSGQPFSITASGVRVLVTCPTNARSGQRIRFNLPSGLINRVDGPKSILAEIKLSYDKDGWTRTIRATDMKFVWTRFDEKGNVEERTRFDTERSAYVLKLDFSDNHLMRKGRISLVTSDQGVVDSKIKHADGTDLVSYSDIAAAQVKSYSDKMVSEHV